MNDARLEKDGPRFALRLERRLPHSPEKVWRALTERELLKQWFPADVEGAWTVGATLRFHFLHGEGDNMPEEDLQGEVLVAAQLFRDVVNLSRGLGVLDRQNDRVGDVVDIPA